MTQHQRIQKEPGRILKVCHLMNSQRIGGHYIANDFTMSFAKKLPNLIKCLQQNQYSRGMSTDGDFIQNDNKKDNRLN